MIVYVTRTVVDRPRINDKNPESLKTTYSCNIYVRIETKNFKFSL